MLLPFLIAAAVAGPEPNAWVMGVHRQVQQALHTPVSPANPATVTAHVDEAWAVTEVTLTASSGDRRFDAAAIEAVRSLTSLPEPPEALQATLLEQGLDCELRLAWPMSVDPRP